MFAEPQFLPLPGGGRLAYDEYGDPHGEPVFFFHGWPASRLQGAGLGPEASALGLRIIAPDRPGIGLSTLQPERRLLDWPPLIAALADRLGLGRFFVAGMSGGGPYVFATAWALPERVRAAAAISGAPPLPVDIAASELALIYRTLLRLKRHSPALARRFFGMVRPLATVCPPRWLVSQVLRLVAPADRSAIILPEVFAGSFACYREAWRGSGLGVALDGEVYSEPWGFAPEEIRVPFTVWHGARDTSFGWKLAEKLAARLPRGTLRVVEGEGHYSLPFRHTREILETLLAQGQEADATALPGS